MAASRLEARPEPSQAGLLVLGRRRHRGSERRLHRAALHKVEILARAVLDVAAALRAVPGQHGQAQLPRQGAPQAEQRVFGCGSEAGILGRQHTLPTTEVVGLLPTSLPLGLALLVVACELALASRQATSTNSATTRIVTRVYPGG